MTEIFQDISKYYAGQIDGNMLVIGKITYRDGEYSFVPDKSLEPFEMFDENNDITPIVHLIGEIHPRSVIEKLLDIEINSCIYLNEIENSGEIEVRSIHKGISASIYVNLECPLIRWHESYRERYYFDVIDVQHLFPEEQQKENFIQMLAESLRDYELFPPLLNLDVSEVYDPEDNLHDPRLRG